MTETCTKPIVVDESKAIFPSENNNNNNNSNNNNNNNNSEVKNHNNSNTNNDHNNNGSEDNDSKENINNNSNDNNTDDTNTDTPTISQHPILTSHATENTDKEEHIEQLQFFSGNPEVEVLDGVIHLYGDKRVSVPSHFILPVITSFLAPFFPSSLSYLYLLSTYADTGQAK